MHTLLTFEVHKKNAADQDAANLRDQIESRLARSNWKSLEIHTTYKFTSSGAAFPFDLETWMPALIQSAYETLAIRAPMDVNYTFLHELDASSPEQTQPKKTEPRKFNVFLRP